MLLAAVSGALRHYLQEQGSKPVEIQAMVPFNLRPLDRPVPRELGNKFGLVFLPLPVGVSGAYRRLIEVHQRMRPSRAAFAAFCVTVIHFVTSTTDRAGFGALCTITRADRAAVIVISTRSRSDGVARASSRSRKPQTANPKPRQARL